jgi:hypothetical protein
VGPGKGGVDAAWAQNRQRTGISNSRIESECAFGEIMRRWSILNAPLQHDIAKAMLIFRVCCKRHNFCISERDPFAGTHGADDFTEPHNSAFDGQRAVGIVVNATSTSDGDPMPQVMSSSNDFLSRSIARFPIEIGQSGAARAACVTLSRQRRP